MNFHELCVKKRLVVKVGFEILPEVANEFGGLFLSDFKSL